MTVTQDSEKSMEWRGAAFRSLLALREGSSGWGYREGNRPCVEPTALAGLALLARGPGAVPPGDGGAAGRLARVQRRDGSLGVSEQLPAPGWTTPYAMLLWQALGGWRAERRLAGSWLLGQEGTTVPAGDPSDQVIGHDTTLVGWPWVNGTHSWVEPTALAVLALRREGFGAHSRVREGLRVIRDRAIATGGWNCGNKSAMGRILRPQPGPTGLALLALRPEPDRSEIVEKAILYLRANLPSVRAAESLGWGLLGLRAWGEEPEGASKWLAESYRRTVGRAGAASRLALLLLASADHALEFFGEKAAGALG